MLSNRRLRRDFAQDLLGPIQSVCGAVARFTPRDKTESGEPCEPSEVDDWSSLIGVFQNGAVGEFLVPGSPRDPHAGKPSVVFRYDLVDELVSAIVEDRDAVPGFDCGATAQAVADAVLVSFAERRWVEVAAEL